MARFDDFTLHEKRVIREALVGAQSEFYDPGHSREDRDILAAMIREIENRDLPFTFGEEPERATIDIDVPVHTPPQRITVTAEARTERAAEPVKPYRHLDPAKAAMPQDVIRENDGFLLSVMELAGEKARNTAAAQQESAQRGRQAAGIILDASRQAKLRTPPRGPAEDAAGGPGETGFLIIKCAHCGDVHAFCAKQPITEYRCGKCGGHTPLTDMYPLRVMCECGSRFNYRTNITVKQMDVNCFKCGCPVAVEWSERRGRYEPIGWAGGGRKGRKK